MTNMFVRFPRDGVWQSVEIDTLTDAELVTFFCQQDPDTVRRWAIDLAIWIRDHVQVIPDEPADA